MRNNLFFRFLFTFAGAFLGFSQASAQTEFPPAYNNQAHYAVGDLVTDYGNLYRCEATVAKPYLDPSKTYQNWELFYVRNNTTIPIGVGQSFPNLQVAWNYVRNARVAAAAYLHLNIVTTHGIFNETISAPLSLNMDSGSQVSILGDTMANITLNFPWVHGFTIDTNHTFGSLANFDITGTGFGHAFYALSNGVISNISGVSIDGFDYQIDAEHGAQLNFGSNVVATNCYNEGCFVTTGALVTLGSGFSFTGDGHAGVGLDAEQGGRIYADSSTITNAYFGIYSDHGSYVECNNSTISNNIYGCEVAFGGSVAVRYSTFSGNTTYDLRSVNQGIIDAQGDTTATTYTENGGGIYLNGAL